MGEILFFDSLSARFKSWYHSWPYVHESTIISPCSKIVIFTVQVLNFQLSWLIQTWKAAARFLAIFQKTAFDTVIKTGRILDILWAFLIKQLLHSRLFGCQMITANAHSWNNCSLEVFGQSESPVYRFRPYCFNVRWCMFLRYRTSSLPLWATSRENATTEAV